jgi:hypothetical protein
MSRTNHHRNQKHQHCGEDFWSRRAGMGNYSVNTYGKRLTIRKERMEQKEELLEHVLKESDDLFRYKRSNSIDCT